MSSAPSPSRLASPPADAGGAIGHAGAAAMLRKLVYMANQIAGFFATLPEGHAAAGTAEHLRLYWAPTMRRDIQAHLARGGEGLNPVARAAVALLAQERAHAASEPDLHRTKQAEPLGA